MKRIFSKATGSSAKRRAMCAIAAASLCSGLLFAPVGPVAAAEGVAVESAALPVDDLSAEDRQIVETVTENFLLLASTPRPSGYMEKVSAALLEWAKEQGIAAVQDESLNIIFDIPATSGREDAPLCVLQAHMDMVCVSVPDKAYDPQNDPIEVIRDDEAGTLRANGTSLGADDGAGVAMIMAVAQGNMEHGPLRAIITVNEETDMKGAANLDRKYVADASYLINVDSEKSDEVAVSSAANVDMNVTGQVTAVAPKGDEAVRVSMTGLTGGHSGLDIDKGRCNANRALAQALRLLSEEGVSFELAEFTGGRAPNAIPAKAEAVLVLRQGDRQKAEQILAREAEKLKASYAKTEKNLSLTVESAAMPARAVGQDDADRLLKFATGVIDGVNTMSKDYEGLVESSSNLGIVSLTPEKAECHLGLRSSVSDRLDEIVNHQTSLASSCGYQWSMIKVSDAWPYNPNSRLVRMTEEIYRELNGTDIKVVAIHAGLECGTFSLYNPSLDIISIGPDVKDVHSPEETLYLASIPKTWRLIEGLLNRIS